MESLVLAFNSVVPIVCYLLFGYFASYFKIVQEEFLKTLNKTAFKLFYPVLMFYNIFKADIDAIPRIELLLFTAASIIAIEVLAIVIVPMIVKENPKRGVIIQALFKGNFILFGLPLTVSAFGSEQSASAAILATMVATIYNITSVIVLEMFNSSGKLDFKRTVINVVKNPLLQGALAGLLFLLLKIKLPTCIVTPIAAISNMTTPLALFVLGGTIRIKSIRKNVRYLAPTLLLKMVLIPAIVVYIGYILGFRGIELFLLMAVHATPIATTSYTMAQNMGGDGELAGQFVVLSTLCCVLTLFLWVFGLKEIGIV